MDDTYQIYVNRVARMTLLEAYQAQAQHIQSSPKFQQQPDGTFEPVSFPGYSIITPPWVEDAENSGFYERLQEFQQQILAQSPPGLVIPLPPDSFHMTLADLIWDSAYRHAIENPDFEGSLRDRIAQSFQQVQASGDPIYWQVLGLMVMPRAIGVCLAPKDEGSYDRVSQLRRAVYQNLDLMALGIEQQYHFTAHITLGYFGDVSGVDRATISQTLGNLTQGWIDSSPEALLIDRAELRKFDDMTCYYRQPDFPILEF